MDRFTTRMILTVCLLGLLACGCSKKQPTRYSWKPGEELQYKLWITQQAEGEKAKADQRRIILRYVLAFRPTEVKADGTAELAIAIEDVSAALSSDEGRKPLDQFKEISRIGFSMIMAGNGKISKLKASGPIPGGMQPAVDGLLRTIREFLPTLPRRLSRGTAWSRQVKVIDDVPPFGELPAETVTSFEVGDNTIIGGSSAVELIVNFRMAMGTAEPRPSLGSDGRPIGNPVVISGKGDGRGKLYFSKQEGRLVAASYDTTMRISTTTVSETQSETDEQIVRSHIELQKI